MPSSFPHPRAVLLGLLSVASLSAMVLSPGLLLGAPKSEAMGDDDVVEVDASLRALPRVVFVPDAPEAQGASRELAKLVASTGLFDTATLPVGTKTAGRVVRVSTGTEAAGVRVEAISTGVDNVPHRRLVVGGSSSQPVDHARLADAIVADLTGERSHLSGEILFVDASVRGERRVRLMLGSGAPVRDASPSGSLARGADLGPGGVVHYAAAAPGEKMQIFAEGKTSPVAVKVPGFLQSVAFSQDGRVAAVIAGTSDGGALYRGLLEGTMKLVETGPGLALKPAFGPQGELAWAAGPVTGPLRVFLDGKPISAEGQWATAPSFCGKAARARLAYMVRQGSSWATVITEIGVGSRTVTSGGHPACSPDGRTLAVARPANGTTKGGVWLVGEDGVAAHRVHEGEVVDLRWGPGPSLPPEG